MNEKNVTKPPEQPSRSWLERLSNLLLREPQDREQLVALLRDAEQRQLLDANALAMIEGVLQVSIMQVRDIMIPRSQMIVVNEDTTLEECLPIIIESGHSRFPVIGDDRDEIIGILLAKELLGAMHDDKQMQRFDIHDSLRPAIFVPESKRLNVLLQEFRHSRNHMAIVVDEYGGVAGLVTIEDVLEQIVGEIADEFDVEEDAYIKQHSKTEYIVKALMPLDEFNEHFNTQLEGKDADTIGGLVMRHFGRLPKRGEIIKLPPFEFKVLHADKRRIHLLQAMLMPQEEEVKP